MANKDQVSKKIGKYIVVNKLGAGGNAVVYKGYDADFDRYVAVKVLISAQSGDPAFRERFRQEARAIAMLEHLHILPVYDFGRHEDENYLVMRLLESGSLEDKVKQGPMDLEHAAEMLTQVASALDYAHKRGVLHRDVKPGNVLLDPLGNAYLADFGIAKMLEESVNLTGGGLVGTPAYLSPEQCLGEDNITGAADQYALGVMLYLMVTGSLPFAALNPLKVIQMHVLNPAPSPRNFRPDLSDLTEAVILKALSKPPTERYPSCTALAEAFTESLAGKGLRMNESKRVPKALQKRIDAALGDLQAEDTKES